MAWQGGYRSRPSQRLLGGRARAPRLPRTVSPRVHVPFHPVGLEATSPGKYRLNEGSGLTPAYTTCGGRAQSMNGVGAKEDFMATGSLPVFANEGGLSRYLDEIRRFPLLEPGEEYMLAKRWR